jgi:hypothetical protein
MAAVAKGYKNDMVLTTFSHVVNFANVSLVLVYTNGYITIYLLVYVDDFIFTSSSSSTIEVGICS